MDVLQKFARFLKIIKFNKGPIASSYTLYRTDTLKEGKLVGEDCMGNKYYENLYYLIGRSRWVDFPEQYSLSYDASQISPEWYGWLHYKTDKKPCEDVVKQALFCCEYSRSWLMCPQENLTGTKGAYYPYSTVRPHIVPWDGKTVAERGPTPKCHS